MVADGVSALLLLPIQLRMEIGRDSDGLAPLK